MTRIEELVLQRQAIDAEIAAEYKKEGEAAARGEAEAQFNLVLSITRDKALSRIMFRHLTRLN